MADHGSHPASSDWDALHASLAGEVVRPGSAGYESMRKPAVVVVPEVRPRAVVRCATPDDVAETIFFAARFGVGIAPRSGGHCFAGRSSTRGIVVDVTPMHSVSVSDDVATIGAGARLEGVYNALAEHGRTIAAGCGPSVGIAGLTLGGGLGILGRKHGLTSDQLVEAEVVLADGRIVTCDRHRDEDLFWALRGAGGGQFGVVTSLTFRTVPAVDATSFHLLWPAADTAAVVAAWQAWAVAAPDDMAASLLVSVSGDLDRPPVVKVSGAMLADRGGTMPLLAELVARARADPTSSHYRQLSYRNTKRYLAEFDPVGDPAPPASHICTSEFFARPLPDDAIAGLVGHVVNDRDADQGRELDFTAMGGAYNRVAADATAFAHRSERFLLKHAVSIRPDAPAAEQQAARAWLGRSRAAAHPWGTGRAYSNIPDPGLTNWQHAYHGANYDRLVQVKRKYDGGNVFRFHQSIPVR